MNSGNSSNDTEKQISPDSLKSYYDTLWQHGASVLQSLCQQNQNLHLTLIGQEQFYRAKLADLENKYAAEIAELKDEHKQDIDERYKIRDLTQKLGLSQTLLNRSLHELQLAKNAIDILKTDHRRELNRITFSPVQHASANTNLSTNRNILYPSPRLRGNLGGELSNTSTYYLRNDLTPLKRK
jgi:hypothetical protein